MKTIIGTERINKNTKQSTMTTWVMGGRVAGMGPISNSPITTNSLFYITIGRVSVLFRHISTSAIIITSITPLVTTTTTDITPLDSNTTKSYSIINMNIFVNRTRKTDELNNIPRPPRLWKEECLV